MITGEEWVGKTTGSATWFALAIVICCYLVRLLLRSRVSLAVFAYKSNGSAITLESVQESVHETSSEVSITEDDLRNLIVCLRGEDEAAEPIWEPAIQKKSDTVSYMAKRRDPKDGGPTQYLSTTIFENVTSGVVRDFYMDSDFRAEWDKTLAQHQQLEVSETTGVEIGRSVKKFPLLSPREYVLVWRVWEGHDDSFYCYIKACEHKLAPRHPKFKRVDVYNSGWRIRNVPGRTACEITMIHQEDLGMRREMSKVGFSRGIWSYVLKMDTHLRRYALRQPCLNQNKNAVSLAHKVPVELKEEEEESSSSGMISAMELSLLPVTRTRSKKQLAKGLLLLGGAMVVMRGSSSVGARIAAACIVNRVVRPQKPLTSFLRKSRSQTL